MNEYELIKKMAEKFPRSREQQNRLFECDAELVSIGGQVWGMTMDEFSPEEDLFTSDNPEMLGANLTVATLSDLFAAGVGPKFFMQAISLPREVEKVFVDGLLRGIKEVLDQTGCSLCGGDVGVAEQWRFCGFAMGPVVSKKPITHVMPEIQQTLWVTGTLGDANLAALQKSPTPSFELRIKETKLIRKCATACIDTSGGFLDALWILHEQNPGMRFEIHLDKLPLTREVQAMSGTGIPKEAALMGGAGEYELLFSTHQNLDVSMETELREAGITLVGSCGLADEAGINTYRGGKKIGKMASPPPCPRAAATVEDHVRQVVEATKNLFSQED